VLQETEREEMSGWLEKRREGNKRGNGGKETKTN
jgi:hypothetical protein